MAEGQAVGRAAEGVVVKLVKPLVKDAERGLAKGAAHGAEHAGADAAERAGADAAGTALRDAEHHVNLNELPEYHNGGQPDLFGSQNVPDDYQPYGDLDRQEFYDRHYNDAGEKPGWKYPENDGFDGPASPNDLREGDVIDRYGGPGGRYTSPNDTPFDERALPPTNLTQPYHQYRVERPLPAEVTQGRIAPAFEQPGGGVQHYFDKPIQWYVDHGYLSVVY